MFGLYAVPGGVDLLVGSELLEVVRQAGAGMVSPERTAVIASTRRTLTTTEKMQLGDGRVDTGRLADVLGAQARELELFDMATMAQDAGTVLSAVMLGAVAAWLATSSRLPFPREAYEATIRRGGKGAEASLRGFAAGWQRVAAASTQRAAVMALASQLTSAPAAPAPALPGDVATQWPAAMHDIVALGLARTVEYQDTAYGELYLQRLQRLLEAERGGDGGAAASCPAMPGRRVRRSAARWPMRSPKSMRWASASATRSAAPLRNVRIRWAHSMNRTIW